MWYCPGQSNKIAKLDLCGVSPKKFIVDDYKGMMEKEGIRYITYQGLVPIRDKTRYEKNASEIEEQLGRAFPITL